MRPWQQPPQQKELKIADSFYSQKKWKDKRKRYFYSNRWCEIGLRQGYYNEAKELDHIIPMQYGGDPYNDNNLQGLTKRVHTFKTKKEIKAKAPTYEHEKGLPLRQWGKLIPVGRKPIACIIGPTGSGKSTLLEAMQPEKYWDHIHQIDNTDWTNITYSVKNDPGYHIIECVGAHFAFHRLLQDHGLTFYIIRVDTPIETCIERRPQYSEAEIIRSNDRQKPIPHDLKVQYGPAGGIIITHHEIKGYNATFNTVHEFIIKQLWQHHS